MCNDGRGRILPSFSAKALSARSAIAIDFPQTALSAFLPPPSPPLPLILCFFIAALIADIHSLLFCFNSVHFFVVFFCFSSLKVQFSRSARILFVFSKPLESAFVMHLTLSSTAFSPPSPPGLLLLSPFQFATAALPLLFCTHTLSLFCIALTFSHRRRRHYHLLSSLCLSLSLLLQFPYCLSPHPDPDFDPKLKRRHYRVDSSYAVCMQICQQRRGERGEEGWRGETENEAQTSQISPAVAKQFNHIAQKFEVSYKNKIHTHMLASACVCVCRALSLSLSRICFVLMSFFVFARIVAGVARCPGSLAQKPLFPGRNRRDISSYPLPLYPLQASPGQTNLNPMQPIPSLFHSSGSRPLELCVTRAGGRGDGVPALPPAAIV